MTTIIEENPVVIHNLYDENTLIDAIKYFDCFQSEDVELMSCYVVLQDIYFTELDYLEAHYNGVEHLSFEQWLLDN
jgi:hypothetical protein